MSDLQCNRTGVAACVERFAGHRRDRRHEHWLTGFRDDSRPPGRRLDRHGRGWNAVFRCFGCAASPALTVLGIERTKAALLPCVGFVAIVRELSRHRCVDAMRIAGTKTDTTSLSTATSASSGDEPT